MTIISRISTSDQGRSVKRGKGKGRVGGDDGAGTGGAALAVALALEPRFMFDAAGVATVSDALAESDTSESEATAAHDGNVSQAPDIEDLSAGGEAVPASADAREIVFLDGAVRDLAALVGSIDARYEVFVLDGSRDGLQQVAEILADRSQIDAIHIISHGGFGELILGSTRLTAETVSSRGSELAAIKNALSNSGDVLLYGCDIAAGSAGGALISEIAKFTGADVAASVDRTGAAELGGDWILESATGDIEADIAVSSVGQEVYSWVFATDDNFDSYTTQSYADGAQLGDWVFSNNDPARGFNIVTDGDIANGADKAIGFRSSGANQSTVVSFGTADGSQFKLDNFVVASGFGSTSFTITGYLDGVAVAGYTQNVDVGGVFSTTVNFTGWNWLDEVRISGADLDIDIDDLNVSPGIPPTTNPSLTATGGTPTYTENGAASDLFSSVTAATNDGGQTFTGMTLTVTNVSDGASEILSIGGTDVALTNGNNVALAGGGTAAVTIVGSTATVTLISLGRTDADMGTLIDGMTYRNTSEAPTTAANRVVTITQITDSGASNNTATPNIASTVTLDSVADVTSVAIANGAYAVGETITVTVTFDQTVTVAGGTPTLALDVGGQTRNATLGGTTTNTTTLTFSYTVQPGDLSDADGVTATVNGITLNGATIRDASGTADNATLTYTQVTNASATVDTVAPVVTDANVSISGASGTGGAFKVGDTVTVTWNNTAGGDNNADTITGATVDFSQFGGGAAVAATNNAGTWTATYVIAAGAIDATNRNVSVTATDNAGNTTTTADTSNATVDSQAPVVTDANI
ncbi:MAG TPA: DUF4347 domain-containing protein, partial [Kaistia sp.]|nr:DUF4347 domain-containing protein [Kaistia sp.]